MPGTSQPSSVELGGAAASERIDRRQTAHSGNMARSNCNHLTASQGLAAKQVDPDLRSCLRRLVKEKSVRHMSSTAKVMKMPSTKNGFWFYPFIFPPLSYRLSFVPSICK